MMLRGAIIAAAFAGTAQAQSVKLLDHEIEALLSGNTVAGSMGTATYLQYFEPGGATIYVEDGAGTAVGSWRVQGDELQSFWSGDADWTGRFVMEFGGTFYWVSKSIPPTPFTILDGEQLEFE